MNLTPKTKDLAAEWAEARLLYPLYSALAREFVIDLPACDDLEAGREKSAATVGRASSRMASGNGPEEYRSINCASSFRPQA